MHDTLNDFQFHVLNFIYFIFVLSLTFLSFSFAMRYGNILYG